VENEGFSQGGLLADGGNVGVKGSAVDPNPKESVGFG
jgi:hypothetical protein